MNLSRPIRCLLLAFVLAAMSSAASAGVFISVNFGPPALPVYEQPPCPAEGYIWSPGYWAWGPYGYYWVPGTWVLAPQPGYLWTPGYWGYDAGLYYWHPGYWGPVVGFYGGIPYGYGYTGNGYYGGYWRGNHFYYNQTVNNVNVTKVTNVYNTTVVNNNTTTVNRVSYNGGPGGIVATPTPTQEAAAREKHLDPTPAQLQHENAAQANPQLRASVNQGRPPIAATAKPGEFKGGAVVAATRAGAPYKAPENRPASGGNNVPHPGNNIPRPPNAAAGNAASRPNNTPRPEGESNNVPRPPSSYQPATPSRGNQPANVPRPEAAPHPETPGSGQMPPRPQTGSPSGGGYPSQNEARPQQPAPRPESVPHPPSEPRTEEPHREQLR
jgi:WXXGXW repeat (2 copies)